MMRSDAPLRVALESNWWSEALPIAALVVSMVSIGLTLWFRYSDRLRLSVKVARAHPVTDSGLGQEHLSVEVVNRSRQQVTVVQDIVFESSQGDSAIALGVPLNGLTDLRLPKVLGPGERVTRYFPLADLKLTASRHFRQALWIRAKVVTGHKDVCAKKSRALLAELVLG
ncbi:hypothetical protein [Galactobacter valiniphilus]|uniref:hypothetical protein n=1 Tax=Galactobacter valiniphilus TaxID=2676122 RepID=UPI003735A823